jgi:hypothetical protein
MVDVAFGPKEVLVFEIGQCFGSHVVDDDQRGWYRVSRIK